MNERMVFDMYGIEPESNVSRQGFSSGGYEFFFQAVSDATDEEMNERYIMSDHLHTKGENGVLIPIRNRYASYITNTDQGKMVLLGKGSELADQEYLGAKLAAFHYRGRSIGRSIESLNRIGQWKSIWEQRIDQLESVWQEKLVTRPQNEFERLFVEYFPYYSGLSENAIQFLVDTEIDTQSSETDIGTICHERFSICSWQNKEGYQRIIQENPDFFNQAEKDILPGKNPFDWVFDHSSRDLAEWLRERFHLQPNTYHHDVEQFLLEYLQQLQLSPYSIRLIYARLILPVRFFETVEQYFTASTEGEKNRMEERAVIDLKNAPYYEQFLKQLLDLAHIPQSRSQIRLPEWIAGS